MNDFPVRYTRKNLPVKHLDSDAWPQLDASELPPDRQAWVAARKNALRAYLRGDALRVICREFGVADSELLRHLNRCLQTHEDGGIQGWRGLAPYKSIKPYTRLARPRGSSGLAGAFAQFLRDHPDLQEKLDLAIDGEFEDALPESRFAHRAVYRKFQRLCKMLGVSQTQYPFTCKDGGKRSLSRYALARLQNNFSTGARRWGGEDATVRAGVGTGSTRHCHSTATLDAVSLDAHSLNFIGTVRIPTRRGEEFIPIERLKILPLIEHEHRVVLGYHVAIGREPGAQAAVEAVKKSLSPWRPRELRLPGHRYPPGAMMPSALPNAVGLCWAVLTIDNASIHYSNALAERIRRVTGAAVNYGPVGKWHRRPLVEALFSSLERAGFTRLPNATGTGPHDPQRQDAVASAVRYKMELEELLDLIDISVCSYNGTPQMGVDGCSPLQRFHYALSNARTLWLPRTLPPRPPQVPDLDVDVIQKTVRGNQQKGRRPYIQIEHVRYTNPVLANSAKLIGQKLRVHVRWGDLCTVRAFFEGGEELGILKAGNNWSRTPHDLKLRGQINSAIKDQILVVPVGNDPVQDFLTLKAQQAIDEKAARRGKRDRVSASATTLARTAQVTQLPVPMVSATKDKPISAPDPEPLVRLPSFLPQVSHRGMLK